MPGLGSGFRLLEALFEESVDVGGPEKEFSADSDPEHTWLLAAVPLHVEGTWREAQVFGGLLNGQQRL